MHQHCSSQAVQSRALLICGAALQIRLSDTASVAIKMPLKGRDSQPIQAVLTLQKFEQLSADLFRRARLPLDEACWQVFPFLCSSMALAAHTQSAEPQFKQLPKPVCVPKEYFILLQSLSVCGRG